MNSPYLQSVLVQPPCILGRELKPFSAYHAAVLMAFDSPFVCGGDGVSREQLMFALWVCGTGFADGPRRLMSGDGVVDAACMAVHTDKFDLQEQVDNFAQYVENYSAQAQAWHDENIAPSVSALPWPFKLVAVLLTNMHGLTEQEAWDMPLSRASCYRASIAEDNGVKLMTQIEVDTVARAKADGVCWTPGEK